MSVRITNLLDEELSDDWLIDNIGELYDLDEAAVMVCPRWTRHYIHKHIKLGRINKAFIIILHDYEALLGAGYNKGKKYFIHKDELDRLIDWFTNKEDAKEKGLKCRFCGRIGKFCIDHPCYDRKMAERRTTARERIRKFTNRTK